MPKFDITQTYILERLELCSGRLCSSFCSCREEVHSLVHAHIQDIIYILAPVIHFQDFRFEAFSPAFFADHLDISHKLHLNTYDTLSLAFRTTSSIGIEGEIIGSKAIKFRSLLFCQKFPDVIEGLEVIDVIAGVATDPYDRPYEDVIIESIRPAVEEPVQVEAQADTTSKTE